MNYQSTLKQVSQGKYKYIYIYFKYQGKIIRINTGNKVVPKYMNKDLSFNKKMVNYLEINDTTTKLKQQVDKYIRFKIDDECLNTISQNECLKYLQGGLPDSTKRTNYHNPQSISDLLNKFYQFKKDELNNRPSYKEYLTLVNSLTDYQKYYNVELTFESLDTLDFMIKYRNFLSLKRGKRFLTSGGLNDNTVNKRFSGLKTFFLWVENKEIYQFKKSVLSFKSPKYDNNIVVMEKDDLRKLIDLKIDNPNWKRIIDVFVCNCFLGLRYSDLSTLKKTDFFIDDDGDYILFKENKKTGFNVQIPVQKTSLEILKRYDFNLPKLSQPYFNREIKNIFEEYDLFSDTVIKKRRVNRTIEDFEVPRRKLISSHSCRRTFVTLGISNNVPLNSLMLSTGHRKIQTLQNYMKKVMDKKSFERIDL